MMQSDSRLMWKFIPLLKSTIWGGNKLAPFKQIPATLQNIGESWEISGMPGSESVVESGPDKGMSLTALLEKYGASLLGKKNFLRFGTKFPLIVKFIDACEDLSVQVHPNDDMARSRGQLNGKTEMWYVVDTEEGSRVANGFCREVNPDEYDHLVETGHIENALNYMKVAKGEVYYIPAGRVHAICSGTLVAEIQQSSDVTYRIYDYKRCDSSGKQRTLHTDLARHAINFRDVSGHPVDYKVRKNVPVNVVKSPFFNTNLLSLNLPLMRDYSENDSFVVLIATEGKMTIECGEERETLAAGQSILIPASAKSIQIYPENQASLLEAYIA